MTSGLLKESSISDITSRVTVISILFHVGIKTINNTNLAGTAAANWVMIRAAFVIVILTLYGCSQSEVKKTIEYTGPIERVEKMETYYTENEKMKAKVLADLVFSFLNGDREFPKGLYIEFYDETGKLESVLKANHAYYFKEEDKWRGRGKVEVKNIKTNEQLNTEELFWKPKDKKIFTESFVTIRQQGDVIYGTGLDAKQDLSEYKITHPYGDFDLKEE